MTIKLNYNNFASKFFPITRKYFAFGVKDSIISDLWLAEKNVLTKEQIYTLFYIDLSVEQLITFFSNI